MLVEALLVALAGGLGASLRFLVDGLVSRVNRLSLPLGTLVINITGSLVLGVLAGLVAHGAAPAWVSTIFGTGMMGGYTTFSTASVEAVNLLRSGRRRRALIAAGHAATMLVVSVGAACAGLLLT
jgi:CrcB protein